MKKQLLLLAMILLPVAAIAHDIEVQNVDGVTIYYNYINNDTELEVTFRGSNYDKYYNTYTANVVIPEEVTYMERTCKVTSIGERAFYRCRELTSVTIPCSVTNIGYYAFSDCDGLQKVIVSDIAAWCGIRFGDNPLLYAHHLYIDEDTEIKDLVIPNSVTSIGNRAFDCCSGLTSVTIPNSVTSIGEYAFRWCVGLTSFTIPNSVTTIGNRAFYECTGLTSITIPNSVTSIEEATFNGCSGLTTVTIPNSVTNISGGAFYDCDISTVIVLIENPFAITGKTIYVYSTSMNTFSLNTFENAMLYVPAGTIDKYKATEGWKDFAHIQEGNPTGISVVENATNNNTTIYDLNGVRQPDPQKGINIINGKKVMVK